MVARANPALRTSPLAGTLPPGERTKLSVHAWMVIAVGLVAAIASWDAQRESAAALSDFGSDQAALAESAADAIAARAEALPASARTTTALLESIPHIRQPGASVVLITRQASEAWTSQEGTPTTPLDPLSFARNDGWTALSRLEAATLGLPARTAVAGFSTFEVAGELWRIAVVTSAEHERDRERHAQWRLVLSVLGAGGLVLAFGGLALRNQRKELHLARELAVSETQRALEERLVRADKLATLGALAIGVAHEIATPLGVIVGRTEQLLPEPNRPSVLKRNVQVVLEQCDRIDRVIRGLLSLARGDSPVLERVEPSSIATKAAELVAHRFVSAGVTLRVDIAEPLPKIACEPRLLEQALANLLLNARDACERAAGHVDLRVEGDAERVAFIVTDNGKGIANESIERVLEPFFTTKPAGEGSGLGLSIANEIVKHNRGSLTLAPQTASPRGGRAGTRACIEIPAVPKNT